MFKLSFLAIGLIFAILAPLSVAAAPAGKAVAVSGSASSSGPTGKMVLATGSAVFEGDTISTGFSGRVQLLFSDRTKLVVGPSSRVKIDKYVLGRNKKLSAFAIRAARGTFRFISGTSKKSAYKISIKSATIGIRGTSFDFANKGRTAVVLYAGSVQVCIGGSCTTLRNKCDLAQQTGRGLFKSTTQQLAPNAYNITFPYIRREAGLLPAFRVGAGACDLGVGRGPGNSEKSDGQGGDNGGQGRQ